MIDHDDKGAGTMTATKKVCLTWAEFSGASADPGALRWALHKCAPDLEDLVGEPPGAHAALRRAIRRTRTPEGYAWREIGVDGGDLIWGLAEEDRDVDAKSYKANAVAAVSVSEGDGKWAEEVDPATPTGAVGALRDVYQKERGVLGAPELWGVIRATVARSKGTKLRDGVYLVPDESKLVALNTALRSSAAGVRAVIIPLDLAPDVKAEMRPTVEQQLYAELQEIHGKLRERREKAAQSGRRIRRDGVQTAIDDAMDLRGKALLLKGLLELETQALEEGISQCEQEARDAIAASWGEAAA